jgi:adenosylmethionine-8-amino-7-oxononanoate aminotransferase
MTDHSGLPPQEIADLEAAIPHIMADFAQMKQYAEDPFILDRGDGVYVFDVQGRRYIDTLAGTASVSVGHRNASVIDAMTSQLAKMTFASPNSSVNSSALRLVNLLLTIVPPNMTTVKLYSGGSEANEGMLKVARQFWYQSGAPLKQKIIGRYGESIGGTLACRAVGGMPPKYGPTPAGFVQVIPGNAAGGCGACRPRGGECDMTCVQQLEDTIRAENPDTVAAVVGAPIGQLIWPPHDYWRSVREICDRYDVLLLFDEIVTGLGRLGVWWGADHVGAYPDLMGIGKGMSGGYAPLAAMLLSERVARSFWGEVDRKFDEGHTFNANPLSSAVGQAVLTYIIDNDLLSNARIQGERLVRGAREIADRYDIFTQVLGVGLWVVLIVGQDPRTGEPMPNGVQFGRTLHQVGRRHGLLIRPYPSHVILAPPLTITSEEVDDMLVRFDDTIAETLTQFEPRLPAGHRKVIYRPAVSIQQRRDGLASTNGR